MTSSTLDIIFFHSISYVMASSVRRQRRQMATARCEASELPRDDASEQLYIHNNGVTGDVDGEVGLAAICC